ncbi:protein farnesyltransferase/geranylgeranyltransferase type-1 subunit alpha [Topomyia yanbarensis]|uniref:protein farnesyltransferase/geranylgeranyltransferase type-1 subunit alpha n=1 Tax=Topomyia yanbarensis TaxID=2498891 RepID=UPI00273B7C2E|nr:protein farnesyltransferase/geranylgeranyltransferase type-1 subunit alpha [Topomyia yanbarensis]
MADGNSSDEDFGDDWVLYANRPEWSDVVPLKQDDGENPVVMIQYSEKFNDVFSYLRAVISSQEKSVRALGLTQDAAKLNAANYTVWQYRRDILKALSSNLYDELDYIEGVIEDNPKNYQVWHHRRVIVEWMNDPSRELDLTENILNMDAKNYHAWQHRQWAIKTYNLFEDELQYVDRLISEDMRNNSAWNERFFVLKHAGFTGDVLEREINYVMNRIRLIKNNESPWNFLRGLLQQGDGTLTQFQEVVDFCEDLYNSGIRSPYLLAFLIDLYEEKYFEAKNAGQDPEQYQIKVQDLCESMANQHDTIRCKYWRYIADSFRRKIEGQVNLNGS